MTQSIYNAKSRCPNRCVNFDCEASSLREKNIKQTEYMYILKQLVINFPLAEFECIDSQMYEHLMYQGV